LAYSLPKNAAYLPRNLPIITFNKPKTTSTNPTGIVSIMNQIYVPVPLPSFHMDPPWKIDVTKERISGDAAKIRPARINGKRFMLKV